MVKEPKMACLQHVVLNLINLNFLLYAICSLVEEAQELRVKTDKNTEAILKRQNVLQLSEMSVLPSCFSLLSNL